MSEEQQQQTKQEEQETINWVTTMYTERLFMCVLNEPTTRTV